MCSACGEAPGDGRLSLREMMFGSRESFEYGVCRCCGCTRILEVPDDLARHYPTEYEAHVSPRRAGGLERSLKTLRAAHALGTRSIAGALLLRIGRRVPWLEWCRRAGVSPADSILDVGCGMGHLLRQMEASGFSRLTGIDPFIPEEAGSRDGVRLLRRDLSEAEGEFDCVMLHHSLEHMPDSLKALKHVRRLLRPGRIALVRIPLAGGFAATEYGADWVQWDAPRHLVVHTRASLERVAHRAGFAVDDVVYDSTGFQFWGSELYRLGIPLTERHLHVPWSAGSVFTRRELRDFEARALELNRSGEGDQACFFLRAC